MDEFLSTITTLATSTAIEGNDSASASAAILEQEQRFMQTMDFNEDMLALLDLDEGTGQGRQVQVSSRCMDSMYDLGQSYRSVHGYISLFVCVAGLLMNSLIIMVLTRKEMRTPINRMLTALALADMLIMAEYIPFTLHMYVFEDMLPQQEQYSYAWAVFVLFHSHFTQILHTINIQLTITMSIWRYFALKRNGGASGSLTMGRCNVCIIAAYICPVLICIPNYLTFSIYHREVLILQPPLTRFVSPDATVVDTNMEHSIMSLCMYASEMAQLVDPTQAEFDCTTNAAVRADWYTVGLSEMATRNGLHGINFWFYSVFVKLIPCFLLTFFMCWLINTLYNAKRRHNMLQCKPNGASHGQTSPSSMVVHTGVQAPLATITADYISLYQGGGCSSAVADPSPPLRHGSGSGTQRTSLPDSVIIEERTDSNSDGGHDCDCDWDKHMDSEPPPPSVVYTPVSPLLSPNYRSSGSGSLVNPSYSAVAYTTLSTANANLNGQARRGSNLSLGVPASTSTAIAMGTSLGSPRRISFENCGPIDRRSSSTSTSTILYPLTAAFQRARHSVGSAVSNYTVAGPISTPRATKSGKRPDRTSKLLIAVLCLFLLTEFPQGIMAFLSGIYGVQFFKKCYNTWAEVWDILALINSSINFILYCFMSKQFRLQFRQLLRLRLKSKVNIKG